MNVVAIWIGAGLILASLVIPIVVAFRRARQADRDHGPRCDCAGCRERARFFVAGLLAAHVARRKRDDSGSGPEGGAG